MCWCFIITASLQALLSLQTWKERWRRFCPRWNSRASRCLFLATTVMWRASRASLIKFSRPQPSLCRLSWEPTLALRVLRCTSTPQEPQVISQVSVFNVQETEGGLLTQMLSFRAPQGSCDQPREALDGVLSSVRFWHRLRRYHLRVPAALPQFWLLDGTLWSHRKRSCTVIFYKTLSILQYAAKPS